jgi:hypothetical protein
MKVIDIQEWIEGHDGRIGATRYQKPVVEICFERRDLAGAIDAPPHFYWFGR